MHLRTGILCFALVLAAGCDIRPPAKTNGTAAAQVPAGKTTPTGAVADPEAGCTVQLTVDGMT